VIGPDSKTDARTIEPPEARSQERLLLRGVTPLKVFDVLLCAPRYGSILRRFEGAWWHLLADGRFFFEPARLNDGLSNAYLLQGVYEERWGSFILQAESYRSPTNLLALDAVIRPDDGQYVVDCIFLNEGAESPILYLSQSLTADGRCGLFYSTQLLKGVPVPALYDIELSGRTTNDSFNAVQLCLYTVAEMSDAAMDETAEVRLSIYNGSVLEAAEEQNGTASLLLPSNTFMNAASGMLPGGWHFDSSIRDGRLHLHLENIPSYQSVFSWCETAAPAVAGQTSLLALTYCKASSLSLDCRMTDDVVTGEIRAEGRTQNGQPAHYQATFKGQRAADVPQTLARLEQKIEQQELKRSWRDKNIFQGIWHSQRFGRIRLRQSGAVVNGEFTAQAQGSITGIATEHRLVFDWKDEGTTGRGVLHAVRGGQFLVGFCSSPEDGDAPLVELLYGSKCSSSLVEDTVAASSEPLEWSRQADILKSLNRLGEALILYEKIYRACGEQRRQCAPHSEAWAFFFSQEWSAVLDFMNCCQTQNLYNRMSVHPQFRNLADDETVTFESLLRVFEYAIQLQAELYALTQQMEAQEGVLFTGFGARLTQQIEFWRRCLNDEASRIEVLETSQRMLAELLRVLVTAKSYEQALVVAESSRARAFSDLMQNRIYREQAQAALSELNTEVLDSLLAQTMAVTAPVELEMLKQTAGHQQSAMVEYFLSDDKLFIWVVHPSGQIDFHEHQQPALRQTLSELIASTRTSMGVQSREAVRKSAAPPPPQCFLSQLTQLYQVLIAPIAQWLPADEDAAVIFVPHGVLFLVPFPALFDGRWYLIDRHTISVAPSIRFVETTHQLAAMRQTHPTGLLIVGDPLMPTLRRDIGGHAERLPQLEFARKEAEQLASKLKIAPLLGGDASKREVLSLLPGQRLIHLATHGLLDEAQAASEIPGAIALASSEDDDDGLLTASQIASLHLQAQLVVMSACNTGQGRLSADGIIGLLRAFLTAGAECVVASLWAIADRSTQELMVEFYEGLRRGQAAATALRHAMLALKADTRFAHPLYWAAFTVTGQSQKPLLDLFDHAEASGGRSG
jgi:CHAT domain-containing protein